eukprot:2647617-Pleurochrysis_carterae.AAC.1
MTNAPCWLRVDMQQGRSICASGPCVYLTVLNCHLQPARAEPVGDSEDPKAGLRSLAQLA